MAELQAQVKQREEKAVALTVENESGLSVRLPMNRVFKQDKSGASVWN